MREEKKINWEKSHHVGCGFILKKNDVLENPKNHTFLRGYLGKIKYYQERIIKLLTWILWLEITNLWKKVLILSVLSFLKSSYHWLSIDCDSDQVAEICK